MNQKQIVFSLLGQAKQELAAVRTVEAELLDKRQVLLEGAWRLGALLIQLKEQIGRGNWQTWICANFRELGSTDGARTETASRCIRFYKENLNVGNSRQSFSADSQRKFLWNYIPAKERPQLKGDRRDRPGAHYLTFVNNFSKWDRQVQIGLAELPPVDELRHDLEPTLRRMIELCGKEWALEKLFERAACSSNMTKP